MKKCLECGLLAVRDEYNDLVCEATEYVRTTGSHQSSQGNVVRAKLFCYANSQSFPEIPTNNQQRNVQQITGQIPAIAVLSETRECDKFRPWWPGKSPKEHEEIGYLEQATALYHAAIAEYKADRQELIAHHQQLVSHQNELVRQQEAMLNLKSEIKLVMEEHRAEDQAASNRIRLEDHATSEKRRKEDRMTANVTIFVAGGAAIISGIVGLIQAGKFFFPDLTK